MRPLPQEAHVYWVATDPATVGDANPDLLYERVGICLTKYEQIEEEFAALFSLFADTASEAAYRAYGSIVAYSSKREMLENAAEIYFEEHAVAGHYRKYFSDLIKHLQKASERRNELAHGQVIGFIADKRLQFFLVPSLYNARKTGAATTFQVEPLPKSSVAFRRAKYHYVASDLEHFAHLFTAFRSFVMEYYDFLLKNYYHRP